MRSVILIFFSHAACTLVRIRPFQSFYFFLPFAIDLISFIYFSGIQFRSLNFVQGWVGSTDSYGSTCAVTVFALLCFASVPILGEREPPRPSRPIIAADASTLIVHKRIGTFKRIYLLSRHCCSFYPWCCQGILIDGGR